MENVSSTWAAERERTSYPLAEHKGHVNGIDILPDTVGLAEKRVAVAGVNAQVAIASAYATGFPDESFDVVFCVALIHHLEIPRVHDEIWRILKNGGYVVSAEPIRFSESYDKIRKLLPAHKLISEYEHPLTAAEFGCMTKSFVSEQLRYFRFPFVPLMQRFVWQTKHVLSRSKRLAHPQYPGFVALCEVSGGETTQDMLS